MTANESPGREPGADAKQANQAASSVPPSGDGQPDLVVLAGGPRSGWWYWLTDLQSMQTAAHRMLAVGQPRSDVLQYAPAERGVPHPTLRNEAGEPRLGGSGAGRGPAQ